jgi:predicted ester cyclase
VQAVDTGKQTIKAFIDAVWVRGDLDALDRFWTDSCVNHAAPARQDVGLAALRSYHESFAASFAAFSDSSIQVFQQVGEDDRVVTHLVTSGRHVGEFAGTPPTGKQVALTTIRIDRSRRRQDRGALVCGRHQRASAATAQLNVLLGDGSYGTSGLSASMRICTPKRFTRKTRRRIDLRRVAVSRLRGSRPT